MLIFRSTLFVIFGLLLVGILGMEVSGNNTHGRSSYPALLLLTVILVVLGPLWPSKENLKNPRITALRFMLRFGLLGPFFGAIAFWLGKEFSTSSFLVSLFLAVWGYPIVALAYGFIPGVFAGLGYWLFLKHRTNKNPPIGARLFVGAFIGLTVSTLYGLLYVAIWKQNTDLWSMVPMFWSAPGLVAGAICAMLVRDSYYCLQFPSKCENSPA